MKLQWGEHGYWLNNDTYVEGWVIGHGHTRAGDGYYLFELGNGMICVPSMDKVVKEVPKDISTLRLLQGLPGGKTPKEITIKSSKY